MSPGVVVAAETIRPVIDHDLQESQYQKGVKHLCENGIKNVPSKYVFPASDRPKGMLSGGRNHNLRLPVVDFGEIRGPNRSQVLRSLASACENYGFFQVVNHGISSEVIGGMIEVGRLFFEQPFEERKKYMTGDMTAPVRYGTSFNQTKDSVFCWRDLLKLSCHPLPDALPYWPSSPTDFRKHAVAYAKETRSLFLELVGGILESLGLLTNTKNRNEKLDEEESEGEEISKDLEGGSQLMVVNFYPPCPQPELTLGMPPHSDYGFLTLLLQDDVEGLQIHHHGNWVTVDPIPGSFVVNVGDCLEILSNGIYKSVLHRVVVNSTKPRISVASLHNFPFKNTVRPAAKLINEMNPRRYKGTDFAAFLDYTCDTTKKNFLESRKLT